MVALLMMAVALLESVSGQSTLIIL